MKAVLGVVIAQSLALGITLLSAYEMAKEDHGKIMGYEARGTPQVIDLKARMDERNRMYDEHLARLDQAILSLPEIKAGQVRMEEQIKAIKTALDLHMQKGTQ